MRLFSLRRGGFLRRALAPYGSTVATSTVDAAPLASAVGVGSVGPTTAEPTSADAEGLIAAHVDDRTPLAGGTSGGQPTTPIETAVARLVNDLHGA